MKKIVKRWKKSTKHFPKKKIRSLDSPIRNNKGEKKSC